MSKMRFCLLSFRHYDNKPNIMLAFMAPEKAFSSGKSFICSLCLLET